MAEEKKEKSATDGNSASPFGNFHNYYKFNPVSERISFFTESLAKALEPRETKDGSRELNFLDVGCNEGDISLQTLEFLRGALNGDEGLVVRGMGVDIDEEQIKRATRKSNAEKEFLSFSCLDLSKETAKETVREHLPVGKRFNLTLILSITMWIHIHHGDEGLKTFLDFLCSVSDNIVIEPQPWRCYATCKKRWRKEGISMPDAYNDLEWTQDVDTDIITYLFEKPEFEKQELGETKWKRKVVWFKRRRVTEVTDTKTAENK